MSRKILIIGIIVVIIAVIAVGIIFLKPSSNQDNKTTVSWDEAIRILNSGEVEQAFQTHSLDITLILKDGKSIKTKEPHIDDILDEIDKCGNVCKDIAVATE